MANHGKPKKKSRQRLLADRYLLKRPLGRGGGGTVYLAEDRLAGGQEVALKLVEVEPERGVPLREALRQEFMTLSLLSHPNLARVYDFGANDREVYFSAEYVAGHDLLTAASGLNLNVTLPLLVQVLRAVDYLHRRGVLHLDLKPDNILVTDPDRTGQRQVKLIDFGIAEWKRQGLKAHGEFCGTPPFAAPELVLGQSPSPASDLYSLGMIFHLLFAGGFPFKSKNPFEIVKEQIYGEAQPVATLHEALPTGFRDILLRMVAREPQRRYASPRQLLEDLNACLQEQYSLRSPTAPVSVLAESDHFFHAGLIDDLVAQVIPSQPRKILLTGPRGIGKTRLLTRVKERLQIGGLPPLHFSSAPAFASWYQDAGKDTTQAVLLDTAMPFQDTVQALSALPGTVLCTAIDVAGTPPAGFLVHRIPPLSESQVADFLGREIDGFPVAALAKSIHLASAGLPRQLEEILQALREAGMLLWSDQGWQWQGEDSLEIPELIERHHRHWEKILHEAAEIQKQSPLPLNVRVIEGLLGLEVGALEGKWSTPEFPAAPERDETADSSREESETPGDESELKRRLEELYLQGDFTSGIALAETLHARLGAGLPEDLALLCARHYVAGGWSQKALQILPQHPPTALEQRGLFHEIRARAKLNLGNSAEAHAELNAAELSYAEQAAAPGLARLWNLRASLHKKACEFEAAERCFQTARQHAETSGDLYLQGMIEMNLGLFFHGQGRIETAQQAYERALELSQRSEHPLLAMLVRHNLVNLLYSMGRSSEAEGVCYEWLNLAIRFQSRDQQAAAFSYLATLAGQKDYHELQLAYLNQAIGLLDRTRYPALLAQLLVNRAYVYWALKKFSPAKKDADAARDLAEQRSDEPFLAWVYLILGKIYRDRSPADFESAAQLLDQAQRIVVKSRNRQLQWEVEFNRGMLAKRRQDSSQAIVHFLAAKQILETLIPDLPEPLRASFMRDRKLERTMDELQQAQLSLTS